jgi:hypothetical protein
MSNLICKENFNWKKYVDRYKDLKSIDNLDNAWNHWCEEGKKQGRKFFTLAPYKNNKYYIITKEYIKQKNIKLKNTKSIVVSELDDDAVIEDFVSNIKHKLKKLNKNNKFVCQTVIQNADDKLIKKEEINKQEINKQEINKQEINKQEINQKKSNIKNNDIEILEKDIRYTEFKTNNKSIEKCAVKTNNNKSIEKCAVKTNNNKSIDEWTDKTENSEIFFIDFNKNDDDSNESKIYFSKKNPLNVFSNSA